MTTKSSAKRALCMAVVMAVSGCRTPGSMGSQGMSASDSGGSDSGGSSQGDSSKSDSGGSSEGDSSKSEGSGDSSKSEGSGDSSNSDGSSESKSSEAGGSSESNSSDSGSSERTSRSSEEGGSSEGSSGTEKAEGEASRSRSDNSSQSNNDNVVSAVTVGALVVGLGVVIWQAYAAAERRRGGVEPKELGRTAQVYLRSRTHQLREDLALGAGPTVEDLAAAANIRRENLGTFGRVLRSHRKELLAMADERPLTPERALAWLERVGELARADPRLEEDRRAFVLTTQGAEGTAEVAH
ncbi:hypothetical protein [Pyxidicoccus trucidator]|uniref:hypothetical protein n=1 Tax=Pyxidicoccus trucidator TaxID=2709662 RepID=UPI001F07137F|nr:hypothetical protein [Pyxidicoccus trucidator]